NPTPAQLQRARRFRPYDAHPRVFEPNGRLHLIAVEDIKGWWADIRTWRDGPRQTIEHCLNACVIAMIDRALYRDRQDEQRRRDQERRDLADRLGHRAERRRKRLTEWASGYAQVQQMHAFVTSLEQRVQSEAPALAHPVRRWLQWARAYVDASDPVRRLLAGEGWALGDGEDDDPDGAMWRPADD